MATAMFKYSAFKRTSTTTVMDFSSNCKTREVGAMTACYRLTVICC